MGKAKSILKFYFIIIVLAFNFFCFGQEKKYSLREEYGLKGKIKKIEYYKCVFENNEIPTDTTNYRFKASVEFDKSGNGLEQNKIWIDAENIIKYKASFSGFEKDIKVKEISTKNNKILSEEEFTYIWLDNFNYKIISDYFETIITLDENYRLIQNVIKQEDLSTIIEKYETIYENDRIKKIKTQITQNINGKINEDIECQIIKKYDELGNPIIIYVYNDDCEQNLKEVIYKFYNYY